MDGWRRGIYVYLYGIWQEVDEALNKVILALKQG